MRSGRWRSGGDPRGALAGGASEKETYASTSSGTDDDSVATCGVIVSDDARGAGRMLASWSCEHGSGAGSGAGSCVASWHGGTALS